MPKTAPFEEHTDRYEAWFEQHEDAYRSELDALRRLVPTTGQDIEIGVGSGRFAAPLEIEVFRGVAEALPFMNATFDTVLIVTTICFVDTSRGRWPRPTGSSRPTGPS